MQWFCMSLSLQRPARDQELVQIMNTAFADAARRSGDWLACRPGCTQCCHGSFAIHALDVLRLREGVTVLQQNDPVCAAAMGERARQWIAEHGLDFPGDGQTGVLDTSEEAQERFEEFANEAACPALNPVTGLCDVYEWRPMTCRLFGPPVAMEGGLACCELCFVDAPEEALIRSVLEVPHELEQTLLEPLGIESETVVAYAITHRGLE